VVGALLAALKGDPGVAPWLGGVAIGLASVNIFGGFAVTARMLDKFRKKS